MNNNTGSNIKNTGTQRMTEKRQALMNIFCNEHGPWSVPDIIKKLRNVNCCPNKTTIYRGLDYLLSIGAIKSVDFGEGKKRYELFEDSDNHHHLFCTNCTAVEEIVVEDNFENQKKNIFNTTNFKVKSHSLEFFGVCGKCQKKENKCQ